jgi:protein phosphatase
VVESAALSDTGRVRTVNQDAHLGGTRVFAVADGVGGAAGGSIASAVVVEGLAGLDDGRPSCDALAARIELADQTIRDLAAAAPRLHRMATTVTAAAVLPGGTDLAVAHVGDSRLYRLRRGRLQRLTEDHTLGAELDRMDRGQTDGRAARSLSHVLTRAVGLAERATPDVSIHALRDGDVFLLCSDGLTAHVDDHELERSLGGREPLIAAARRLVATANARGGSDNITVALFRVGAGGR